MIGVRTWLVLGSGILGMAAPPAAPVPLMTGKAPGAAIHKSLRSALLKGEVPGVQTESLSMPPNASAEEDSSQSEDRVYLVLAGSGEAISSGQRHPLSPETIAHFPLGSAVELHAAGSLGLDVLVLRQTLTPADLEDLKGYPEASRRTYVKIFRECEAYGESIKSARTVSRTLLPKLIVPRMAIGTVETTGPDRVEPHRHPMLEQYFLGLRGNEITVLMDERRASLGTFELLHIPLGSNHGAEVAEGKKLYYVWMDFFQDRKGLEWLNEHKPLTK